jgi:hypothetical protein
VRISPSNHLLDADLLSWSLAQPQWIGGGVNILAPPVRDSHPGAKKVINKKQQNKISRW